VVLAAREETVALLTQPADQRVPVGKADLLHLSAALVVKAETDF
jgi:hypothetical protein